MADFETSYYLTNKIEGGYANDKDDKGGETYRGVARNFHPKWEGWKIIDEYKKHRNFPGILDTLPALQLKVKQFYLKEFWNKIKGDLIPDQRIANEVYDNAVNLGVPKSGEYLQRTINILNRNKKSYQDIKVDSIIGPITIAALNTAIKVNGVTRVLNVINGFQMKHYVERMEEDPTQEKYIGWFDRVEVIWT